MAKSRKVRSDKTVKTIEKELGVKLYKPDGKKQPANKKLGTIRKEQLPETDDQKIAAKRTLKTNPKIKQSDIERVNSIISLKKGFPIKTSTSKVGKTSIKDQRQKK